MTTPKPKPISSKIIASPDNYIPTRTDLEIAGTFNPGVATIKTPTGIETIVMVRVAEAPIKKISNGVLLPYAEIKSNEYKISFDFIKHEEIRRNAKKEIMFKNHGKKNSNICRLKHISHYKKIRLDDNGNHLEQSQEPVLFTKYEYERFGIEDVRIIPLNPELQTNFGNDKFLLTYVIPHRDYGICTAYATTNDFEKFRRIGPDNKIKPTFNGVKDIAIFPEKINKKISALTRPNAYNDIGRPGIWHTESPDGFYWGNDTKIITSETGGITGTNNAPIKLENIWIGAFHEVNTGKNNKSEYVTRLYGLDLKNPSKVKCISSILLKRSDYNHLLGKKPGYVSPVVYTTGMTIEDNTITCYSGVDDKWLVRDQFDKKDILSFLKNYKK